MWIEILELLAVIIAFLACAFVFVVLVGFARRIFPKVKPQLVKISKTKPKKEKPNMSKEKGESITFNDVFMFFIAVPLVLLWVGFAGFVIHTGLGN